MLRRTVALLLGVVLFAASGCGFVLGGPEVATAPPVTSPAPQGGPGPVPQAEPEGQPSELLELPEALAPTSQPNRPEPAEPAAPQPAWCTDLAALIDGASVASPIALADPSATEAEQRDDARDWMADFVTDLEAIATSSPPEVSALVTEMLPAIRDQVVVVQGASSLAEIQQAVGRYLGDHGDQFEELIEMTVRLCADGVDLEDLDVQGDFSDFVGGAG